MPQMIVIGGVLLLVLFFWLMRSRWFDRFIKDLEKPIKISDSEVLAEAKRKKEEVNKLAEQKKAEVNAAQSEQKEFASELKEVGLQNKKKPAPKKEKKHE